eukprot:966775-Amphidinium_carterae.1
MSGIQSWHSQFLASVATHLKLSFPISGISGNPSGDQCHSQNLACGKLQAAYFLRHASLQMHVCKGHDGFD